MMVKTSVEEINNALKYVSFKMIDTDEELILKSKISLLDKSIIGSFLILCGGFFMIYITAFTFIETKDFSNVLDIIWILIFCVFAITLLVVGGLGVYSASTDFVKVNKSYIEFKSSSFRSTKVKLNSDIRFVKKSFTEYFEGRKSSGNTFRVIELYLAEGDNEKLMLNFQMDESKSTEANLLGEQIKFILRQKRKEYLL